MPAPEPAPVPSEPEPVALQLKDLADDGSARFSATPVQPTPAPGPADPLLASLIASLDQSHQQNGGG